MRNRIVAAAAGLFLAFHCLAQKPDEKGEGATVKKKVEKTAERAAKFTEKTAKRSAKFVEKTAEKTGSAVKGAAEKSDRWIRRQVE